MSDTIDLNRERAKRKDSYEDMTPEEALSLVQDRIKDGRYTKVSRIIIIVIDEIKECDEIRVSSAGMNSIAEEIGYLELAKDSLINGGPEAQSL